MNTKQKTSNAIYIIIEKYTMIDTKMPLLYSLTFIKFFKNTFLLQNDDSFTFFLQQKQFRSMSSDLASIIDSSSYWTISLFYKIMIDDAIYHIIRVSSRETCSPPHLHTRILVANKSSLKFS